MVAFRVAISVGLQHQYFSAEQWSQGLLEVRLMEEDRLVSQFQWVSLLNLQPEASCAILTEFLHFLFHLDVYFWLSAFGGLHCEGYYEKLKIYLESLSTTRELI